jgi:hypothetical protein
MKAGLLSQQVQESDAGRFARIWLHEHLTQRQASDSEGGFARTRVLPSSSQCAAD